MKKIIVLFIALSLSGCLQNFKIPDITIQNLTVSETEKFKHDIKLKIAHDRSKAVINDIESNLKKIKPKKPLTLKIKNILIEDFIALVFGDVLKYPYVLDRSIEQLNKKIDIEISNPKKSDSLFSVVVTILENYGVDVQDIDGVILFMAKKSILPIKNDYGGSAGSTNQKDIKAPPADCVFTYKPVFTTSINLKSSIEKILQNENSKVIVSEQNNKLIIRSTEQEKRMVIKLLRIIDEKQKLIACDVTLAEITLTGDLSIGLQGFLKGLNLFEFKLGINSDNGFGLTGSLFSGDSLKAILQMGEKRGMIKIKANPYLLIADGSESSIEIGSEYPILKSEQAAASSGTGVIQSVEYRKTGIIISLRPVVSGDSVHLVASVEMSEGQKNTISSINSPSILTRKIKFNVVLLSDQSLIVGGLVNEVKTNDDYFFPTSTWGLPYGKSKVSSRSEIVLIVKIKVIENEVYENWFIELSEKYEAQKISLKVGK